jgi:hypothetical protein
MFRETVLLSFARKLKPTNEPCERNILLVVVVRTSVPYEGSNEGTYIYSEKQPFSNCTKMTFLEGEECTISWPEP